MGNFIAGVFFAIVVAVAGGYALLISGLVPANADARPGGAELWVAGTALSSTIHHRAPRKDNPIAPTDANLTAGVKLYASHCAFCHGTTAGAKGASALAQGLYPSPPQLATDGVEDDADGVTFWKIKHGIRLSGMPAWGGALSDDQIWTVAGFLKHMDKLPPGAAKAWKLVKN